MARAIYLTHPEVAIDPAIAVTDWQLSDVGARRVQAVAQRLDLHGCLIVSSAERKALETAWPLAAAAGTSVVVRPQMHENDRSATGYLAGPEFEATADAFFADPENTVRGWERAVDAQARIVAEVRAVLEQSSGCEVVFCGHGAVGTLLYCALSGLGISRKWDQTLGGSWFSFDTHALKPEAHWRAMEDLV